MPDTRPKDVLTHFRLQVSDVLGYAGTENADGAYSEQAISPDRYYGQIVDFTPPPRTIRKLEAPVAGDGVQWADGGLEEMEATLESQRFTGDWDALFMHEVSITADGAAVTGATSNRVRIEFEATVTGVEDSWTAGEQASQTVTFDVFAYKRTEHKSGTAYVTTDINTRTLKRVVDQVDQLAHVRAGLGMEE